MPWVEVNRHDREQGKGDWRNGYWLTRVWPSSWRPNIQIQFSYSQPSDASCRGLQASRSYAASEAATR